MTLDSWLVGRLARELDGALAGARIEEVRADAQSLTIACYRRGTHPRLLASFEPERPLAAVIPDALTTNENGPGGWVAGVAALLRGSVVDAVQAVPHDRILNVDMSSRSAFGVPARHRVTLELEPRKANALVLRPNRTDEWLILAAAKCFDGRDGAREIAVGENYTLPPPRPTKLDRTAFLAALRDAMAEHAPAPAPVRVIARLLGEFDPTCTPPLAREVTEQALAHSSDADLGQQLLVSWAELRARVEHAAEDLSSSVYDYRRGDEIVACHVVPLHWPTGEPHSAHSVNELCADALSLAERTRVAPAGIALRKRLARMLTRCDDEVASLRAAQRRAQDAEVLRIAGDAIYANLAAIAPGSSSMQTDEGAQIELDARLSAKQNAAAYFKRYKKARSGLPRIAARLQTLAANREFWEQLLWELERADAQPALRPVIHADVAAAVGRKGRAVSPGKPAKKKPGRPPVADAKASGIELPDGAIAFVGRSPKDNERLTFVVASPNDYWFHARGIPGAHVILKLPHANAAPNAAQIEAAAALAAGASRAADAAKVEVDYTRRKHVRRQGKGRVGLVWYTDFKTLLVAPRPR
jgi:predicted ribosome quality control (RQC) complex YloA/Tae2 family protein